MDLPVRVTFEIGRKRVTLAELARLGPRALLVLEREAHEPADILVNGKVVARGEVVTVDGSYGVRVTEVLGGSEAQVPRSLRPLMPNPAPCRRASRGLRRIRSQRGPLSPTTRASPVVGVPIEWVDSLC